MKPSVYIETTIISYLTARPSRDLIVAGHQQITAECDYDIDKIYAKALAVQSQYKQRLITRPFLGEKKLKKKSRPSKLIAK